MPIRSMTGCGVAEVSQNGISVQIEISCVNRKQFDLYLSFPSEYILLEAFCREKLRSSIIRGRVNCRVKILFTSDVNCSDFSVDKLAVAKRMIEDYARTANVLGVENDLKMSTLLTLPQFANQISNSPSSDDVKPVLEKALDDAINSLQKMREMEGNALVEDLRNRVIALSNDREKVLEIAPSVPVEYRNALLKRLESLNVEMPLDNDSFAREIAFFVDKCDITEELTRLNIHIEHFKNFFDKNESCGRQLDFLCQEVNREINTIGSKANNSNITTLVIAMKAKVEEIREQVQNIE